MDARKLSVILLTLGVLTTFGALVWWASFYGAIIKELGKEASLGDAISCLYSSGGACAFIAALAQLGGKTPYTPTVFWIGAALLVGGIIIRLALKAPPTSQAHASGQVKDKIAAPPAFLKPKDPEEREISPAQQDRALDKHLASGGDTHGRAPNHLSASPYSTSSEQSRVRHESPSFDSNRSSETHPGLKPPYPYSVKYGGQTIYHDNKRATVNDREFASIDEAKDFIDGRRS